MPCRTGVNSSAPGCGHVLVFAGVELIFFTAACMVLWQPVLLCSSEAFKSCLFSTLLLHFCVTTMLAVLKLIQKRLSLVLLHYYYYYLKNRRNFCLPFRLQNGSSVMAAAHTTFVNRTLFAVVFFFFNLPSFAQTAFLWR